MGYNVSDNLRDREGVSVMISFSPDGIKKYIPTHSFQNLASWYYYGTTPTLGYLPNTWMPVTHLGKSGINNLNLCVMPSSLVHYVNTKYPTLQYPPSAPAFQLVKTTRVHTSDSQYPLQGFATIIPGETDPFDPSIGGYSSHLLTGCRTDPTDLSYIYVQSTGYVGNSSVLVNQSGSLMNSAFYENTRGDYINSYVYTTDPISSFDKVTKVVHSTYEQSLGTTTKYYVAINFNISLQALNYDLESAMKYVPVGYHSTSPYGVQVPIYCYAYTTSANPSWSFTWEDVYVADRSYWGYNFPARTFYLEPNPYIQGFARAWRSGSSGYIPQGAYYLDSYTKDNINYCWLSGSINFEFFRQYMAGCPKGYTGISIGSPIVSLHNSLDYMLDSSQSRWQLLMSCATNVEVQVDNG